MNQNQNHNRNPKHNQGQNQNWKKQAANQGIDNKKLEFLTEFMTQAQNTNKEGMMPLLMNIASQANQRGVSFSNSETDMIMELLANGMSKEERARMEQMRKLAGMMGQQKRR